MKIIQFLGTVVLTSHASVVAAENPPPTGGPVLPETSANQNQAEVKDPADNLPAAKQGSTATDRIISEAPATVVVKPSNPFSGFRKVDKNGDGTVSLNELMLAFQRADANGDERLSLEEFQQDIIDQPLDAGGTPDEPRIIIQRTEPAPARVGTQPAPARNTPAATDSGKATQQKNSGKNDRDRDRDSNNDDGVDIDLVPDNSRGSQSDRGNRDGEQERANGDREATDGANRENENVENDNGEEQSGTNPNNAGDAKKGEGSGTGPTKPATGGQGNR